jgi:hypothetical protein
MELVHFLHCLELSTLLKPKRQMQRTYLMDIFKGQRSRNLSCFKQIILGNIKASLKATLKPR